MGIICWLKSDLSIILQTSWRRRWQWQRPPIGPATHSGDHPLEAPFPTTALLKSKNGLTWPFSVSFTVVVWETKLGSVISILQNWLYVTTHRIHYHRVFKDLAKRGKTFTGWFYGLKLHMLINEQSELLGFAFSSGNVSDNNPEIVSYLCTYTSWGKNIGDAGYVSQKLFEALYDPAFKCSG